ncbi:glycoside hydrolase family 24 protein [Acidovorax sp. NCPPB 3576]|uniref:glycoside hydrolase family 24 protein n=1 Tax=Acidovorax sp. NCPPB 3576 TaxID=2940488 RepID=UPI00234B3456|nr:glycoside hydrolase family 104 protein [Acidovorax sp. NCPPB 3576]WCM86638.1 glycoside hydrolase family 104 protein [Acidovorax sp. NCPPB 3576]
MIAPTHDPIALVEALTHGNVRAFLRMLRHGEGTAGEDGYRVMFGGGLFDSFADHPRQAITRKLGGTPITSTAAGAYQFLLRTWDGLVKQYGFADFSPSNQDLGAVALIKGRKALDDVLSGRFEDAVRKCNREWASLPGSPYGQPVVTIAQARQEYEEYGGTYAPEPSETISVPLDLISQPINLDQPKEVLVTPFIAAVLPSLIDLVPKLGKLFSSGSETSERNIKAAEIVVSAAKEAIGARNEQELMETIEADPEAAAAAKAAIEAQWFRLEEVGGGITAAREANAVYLQPNAPGFWLNPAFWVSAGFLLMPLLILLDMLFVHPDVYNDTLRIQIVTAILALLGVIGAYWLGTSFSSQRKSDSKIAGG